jgi:hypothetical protein
VVAVWRVAVAISRRLQQFSVSVNQVRRNRGPGFLSIHANNTNATRGFFDISLVFGELILIPGPDPQSYIDDKVQVSMSWEHAKAINKLLERSINEYEEKNNAKIRDQPETPEVSA